MGTTPMLEKTQEKEKKMMDERRGEISKEMDRRGGSGGGGGVEAGIYRYRGRKLGGGVV